MQSPNTSDNLVYPEISVETQTETAHVQGTIQTGLVENEIVDGSSWYTNGYQWQPYMPQTMDPYVWPTSPGITQNHFNLKPMVASAPVTPSVIPYHGKEGQFF